MFFRLQRLKSAIPSFCQWQIKENKEKKILNTFSSQRKTTKETNIRQEYLTEGWQSPIAHLLETPTISKLPAQSTCSEKTPLFSKLVYISIYVLEDISGPMGPLRTKSRAPGLWIASMTDYLRRKQKPKQITNKQSIFK